MIPDVTYIECNFALLTRRSDARKIGFTCRCGNHWHEMVPRQLHECKDMMLYFECPTCHQGYVLCNKSIRRFPADGEKKPPAGTWVAPGGEA